MNTYYIDGYRIAARSMTQARFAAIKLAEANAPRDYDPEAAKAEVLAAIEQSKADQ